MPNKKLRRSNVVHVPNDVTSQPPLNNDADQSSSYQGTKADPFPNQLSPPSSGQVCSESWKAKHGQEEFRSCCVRCSRLTDKSEHAYQRLFPAAMVVGGFAAFLLIISWRDGLLESTVSHLLYGGLLLSIITFVLIAIYSHVATLLDLHPERGNFPLWLPLGTLIVTTLEVVVAAQLWYIDYYHQSWMASATMGSILLLVSLIPLSLLLYSEK